MMTSPLSTPPVLDLPDDPVLLQQQNAQSVPISQQVAATTSPINPPDHIDAAMPNFPADQYDLADESHLMRLMKVLLGDAGVGQLRKRSTLARMEMSLFASQFLDIDTFVGGLFSYSRKVEEKYSVSPYRDTAIGSVWQEQAAQDAAFKSRVDQFLKGINLGPTRRGIEQVAQAITGVECDVFEVWTEVEYLGYTYETLERMGIYGALESFTYGELEGPKFGRTTGSNRAEFTVRPRRVLTAEEKVILTQVLTRLKPSGSLLTIEGGVDPKVVLTSVHADADSTYWQVVAKIAPAPGTEGYYQAVGTVNGEAVEQPRPALSEYQGEAWSYNADINKFSSYTETEPGVVGVTSDYQLTRVSGQLVDFGPEKAIQDIRQILAARAVSDAVMASMPYATDRSPGTPTYKNLDRYIEGDILGAGMTSA